MTHSFSLLSLSYMQVFYLHNILNMSFMYALVVDKVYNSYRKQYIRKGSRYIYISQIINVCGWIIIIHSRKSNNRSCTNSMILKLMIRVARKINYLRKINSLLAYFVCLIQFKWFNKSGKNRIIRIARKYYDLKEINNPRCTKILILEGGNSQRIFCVCIISLSLLFFTYYCLLA